MNWSQCPEVWIDPDRMSGAPCFRQSRVPIVSLFENLDGGATIDEFVDWFPGITHQQVHAVLAFAIASVDAERAVR